MQKKVLGRLVVPGGSCFSFGAGFSSFLVLVSLCLFQQGFGAAVGVFSAVPHVQQRFLEWLGGCALPLFCISWMPGGCSSFVCSLPSSSTFAYWAVCSSSF
ncbi:hypothetical protein U1Q18_014918 [Sarracenia purpurea var. burkii]